MHRVCRDAASWRYPNGPKLKAVLIATAAFWVALALGLEFKNIPCFFWK